MVFILLTLVFLLMRVAPGDPISASLGGHAPQSQIDEIKAELGYDEPIWKQYLHYLGQIAARRSRHDDHRSAPGHRHRPRQRRGDARADLLRDDRRTHRRRDVRAAGGPLSGHVDRRNRAAVRDRHLRDARLLPRPHGAALLRLVPRLASDLRSGEPDRAGHDGDAHRALHGRLRSSTATGMRSSTRSST